MNFPPPSRFLGIAVGSCSLLGFEWVINSGQTISSWHGDGYLRLIPMSALFDQFYTTCGDGNDLMSFPRPLDQRWFYRCFGWSAWISMMLILKLNSSSSRDGILRLHFIAQSNASHPKNPQTNRISRTLALYGVKVAKERCCDQELAMII